MISDFRQNDLASGILLPVLLVASIFSFLINPDTSKAQKGDVKGRSLEEIQSAIEIKKKACAGLKKAHDKLLNEVESLKDEEIRKRAKEGRYINPIRKIAECELGLREEQLNLNHLREIQEANKIQNDKERKCKRVFLKRKYANEKKWLKKCRTWEPEIKICRFQCDKNRYLQAQGYNHIIFSRNCYRYVCQEEKKRKREEREVYKAHKKKLYREYQKCLSADSTDLCPDGEVFDDRLDDCRKKCSDGEAYDFRHKRCRPICYDENTKYDPKSNKCVPRCPPNQVFDSTLEICRQSCPDGEKYDVRIKKCRPPCPQGQTFDRRLMKCRKRCPDGEIYDLKLGKCRAECSQNEVFDHSLVKCRMRCQNGQVFDYNWGKCRPKWMTPWKWKVSMGGAYSFTKDRYLPPGTELEIGEVIGPAPGSQGVLFVAYPEGKHAYGSDSETVFVTGNHTKVRIPAIAPTPPPPNKKSPYFKVFLDALYGRIKAIINSDHTCVETENAVASCLGTLYQMTTSKEGDEIAVLEGIVNILPKISKHGLIQLGPGEVVAVDHSGVRKRFMSRNEAAKLQREIDELRTPFKDQTTGEWESLGGKNYMPSGDDPITRPKESDGWEPIGGGKPKSSSPIKRSQSELWEREIDQDANSHGY